MKPVAIGDQFKLKTVALIQGEVLPETMLWVVTEISLWDLTFKIEGDFLEKHYMLEIDLESYRDSGSWFESRFEEANPLLMGPVKRGETEETSKKKGEGDRLVDFFFKGWKSGLR